MSINQSIKSMISLTPPRPKNCFSKIGSRAQLNYRQSASNFNVCSFHATLSIDLKQFTEFDSTTDDYSSRLQCDKNIE